jgi:hypothetical protein
MNNIEETKIEYSLFFNKITNFDDTDSSYEADGELGTFYITSNNEDNIYELSFDTGIESYDIKNNTSNGENLYEDFGFSNEQIIMCDFINNNIVREYDSFEKAQLVAEIVNLYHFAIINN